MDAMYRENILDHYRHPRNFGTLESPDIHYQDSNPFCGDEITVELKIDDNRVSDVRFRGRGCAISQASASMLSEEIKGKTLDDVKKIDKDLILELLGIPLSPTRLKCALLSLKVLKAGVWGLGQEDEE